MKDFSLFNEIMQQLEQIDREQALLQAYSHTAFVYARWCETRIIDLDDKRAEIEKLLCDCGQATALFSTKGY